MIAPRMTPERSDHLAKVLETTAHLRSLAESAKHWNDLATETEAFGDYEASRGSFAGVQRAKAESYRRGVVALFLQAETGWVHCSCCLKRAKGSGT